jgi:hypothetical protein
MVTRFAADDAHPTEIDEARALVENCSQCAELARDIDHLIEATASLPVPRRPRDFRISADEAEALRGSWLERLLRRLAAPSLAPLRPVAGLALSLGIVLVVAGATLPGPSAGDTLRLMDYNSGAPAAEATPRFAPEMPDVAPAPGSEQEPARGGAASGPDSVDGDSDSVIGEGDVSPAAEPQPATDSAADELAVRPTAGTDFMRSALIYGGMLVALASFSVLLLTTIARRRTRDPLLR